MKSADVTSRPTAQNFQSKLTEQAKLNACYSHVLLLLPVKVSSIVLQMDSADGAPHAAVFLQASGRVDGLLPGHSYRLCGDSTDMNAAVAASAGGGSSVQPIMSVSSIPVHSHAFH